MRGHAYVRDDKSAGEKPKRIIARLPNASWNIQGDWHYCNELCINFFVACWGASFFSISPHLLWSLVSLVCWEEKVYFIWKTGAHKKIPRKLGKMLAAHKKKCFGIIFWGNIFFSIFSSLILLRSVSGQLTLLSGEVSRKKNENGRESLFSFFLYIFALIVNVRVEDVYLYFFRRKCPAPEGEKNAKSFSANKTYNQREGERNPVLVDIQLSYFFFCRRRKKDGRGKSANIIN